MRSPLLLAIIISCAACSSANIDPKTPDGAHNLFVQSFAQKDYKTIYSLLTQETKNALHQYLNTTKEVVSIIRSQYPEALREKAIADLSIPFSADTFAYHEIETAPSEEAIFMNLCDKMFASKNETPSLMQKFATRVQSTEMETSDKAVITTLANEKLIYEKEPDQVWRTAEIFGMNFSALVMVSRQNLEITKTNVDIFSK
jgi:transcription termination factor NusB